MALINCPDCGREVSDRAAACIHCGCPLNDIVSRGKVMIKVSKHPRESNYVNGVHGTTVDVYLFTTSGKLIASAKTGSVISLDVPEQFSFYASFYKNDKNSLLNNKTKSDVITVQPNTITRLQLGFAQSFWTNKIIISQVDYIDAE